MKSSFVFMITGFVSGETDMPSLLARRPELNNHVLVNAMFDAMVEAHTSREPSGKFMDVTILGHSDRDQTPGRSDDERRENELRNSVARAESFYQWMLAVLAYRLGLPAEGLTAGDRVLVYCTGVGAARLNAPPTTEANRLLNRCVEVCVGGLNVDAVTAQANRQEMI